MLNDATCFKAVYIVCGYTDLRAGMDRLAALVEAQTGNRPYVPDTLYLFCGRRTDRIKGLVWEGDGWLLLYKRLSESRFQWPRTPEEVRELTPQQFRWLMEGLTIARALFREGKACLRPFRALLWCAAWFCRNKTGYFFLV